MKSTVIQSMDEVDAASWDALVPSGDPLLAHAFLAAMEVNADNGPVSDLSPEQQAEQCRLATALRTEHRDELASRDLQVNAVENRQHPATGRQPAADTTSVRRPIRSRKRRKWSPVSPAGSPAAAKGDRLGAGAALDGNV